MRIKAADPKISAQKTGQAGFHVISLLITISKLNEELLASKNEIQLKTGDEHYEINK
ncbi:MAG: hypothetical protein RSA97_08075 [Oscillospiraceae bacterium]